jgi:uroporphyrinogen decarboxylase
LLAVLRREVPGRPTLFEFFMNDRLYRRVVPGPEPRDQEGMIRREIAAFERLGYDYTTVRVPGFDFSEGLERQSAESVSLNEGGVISNRPDLERHPWPDPDLADYQILDRLGDDLPRGMKLVLYTPGGVLENVVSLVGYEALCYMMVDDPQLVEAVFDQVGTRLLRYYERAVGHEAIGACISNDDWGFKTGTLLSPASLRKLVFPWHKRFVELSHAAGKPMILHSCGKFEKIIDDVIDEMGFDGRHSYEDNIMPVEESYERYHQRIAILGGIDVDFVCQSSPEEVYERSRAMLERVAGRGGYALGTGNSVPEYVPDANYIAMVRAALDLR